VKKLIYYFYHQEGTHEGPCKLQNNKFALPYIQPIHEDPEEQMEHHLDAQQAPEYALHQRGYSTLDYLHTVILEKTNECGIPIHRAFVDYEKAFDFIQHHAVFDDMAKEEWQKSEQKC
jgi:hypothetical protein